MAVKRSFFSTDLSCSSSRVFTTHTHPPHTIVMPALLGFTGEWNAFYDTVATATKFYAVWWWLECDSIFDECMNTWASKVAYQSSWSSSASFSSSSQIDKILHYFFSFWLAFTFPLLAICNSKSASLISVTAHYISYPTIWYTVHIIFVCGLVVSLDGMEAKMYVNCKGVWRVSKIFSASLFPFLLNTRSSTLEFFVYIHIAWFGSTFREREKTAVNRKGKSWIITFKTQFRGRLNLVKLM